MNIIDRERASFEAWYRLHHGCRDVYERDASGEYVDKQVQGAFNVWQARAALDRIERDALAAKVERLTEALRELEECVQRDEAMLRQAMEGLDSDRLDIQLRTAIALRERLGNSVEQNV